MRGEARAPLRSVAIAGDGPVGLAAAIALRQALPHGQIRIVPAPADPAALADHAVTTLPQSGLFHRLHGIDEDGLMMRAGASHRLAVAMAGWTGPNHLTLHPYGPAPPAGVDAAATPSVPARLAAAGRFADPADDPASPLSDIDYALRFHPSAYRRHLAGLARAMGVTTHEAELAGVILDGVGRIAQLRLANGQSLAADLFVDCTGPRALLASALPDCKREDWARFLPCDRLVLPARPAPPQLTPLDHVEAMPSGWKAMAHGRDATHICAAGNAAIASAEALARSAGFEPGLVIALEPGRQREAWQGNVVCFGDAAARFEPLHWLNLALAHAQIRLFLELLPGREADVLEQREFNRRSAAMADRVRDHIALHYGARPARPGPFWVRAADLEQPESLQRTLGEYRRRGRLPFFEEELLPQDAWIFAMATIGAQPGPAAHLLARPAATQAAMARAQHARGAAALTLALPYPQWLATRLQTRS